MKKFLLLILFSLLAISGLEARQSEEEFEQANVVYDSGDYLKASQLYLEMLNGDYVSSEIYYNLGNCYSKMDNLAMSILYYNRAALLNPSDENIQYNLEIATTKTTNRIDKLPQFFLKAWFVSVSHMFSSNTWTINGLVMLAVMFASVVIFYFSNRSIIRKVMFSLFLVSLILTISAFVFSSNQKYNIQNSNVAIVMENDVAVKSSPSDGGTDLFILNEGAKIQVREVMGKWSEIVIESGNSGWLENAKIKYIRP